MSFQPISNLNFDGSGHLVLSTSPASNDSSTKAATTAYVKTVMASHTYAPGAVAITGGSVNNTVIGATTPNTGAFTTGTITGATLSNVSLSGTLKINGAWVRTVRNITSGATVAMNATDDVLVINKTTGSATAVTLPASPVTGRRVVVKDGKGDSNVNSITVSAASGNIDGAASFLINRAYGFGDFLYNGTEWSAFTAGGTVQQESPEGTTVTTDGPIIYASTTTGSAATGTFNTFATSAGQIVMNGVTDGTTHNVVALVYHNHGVFQHATDNSTFDSWWYWDTGTSAWIEYAVNSISLSGNNYSANASANTVIGTLTVVMKTSGVLSGFSGSVSVSDTIDFKIVSGNTLEANTTLTQPSYTVTFTATPSVVGNAFTTGNVTISQTVTAVPYGTSAPATMPLTTGAVSPLGWPVDFFDDFTGTFTRSSSATWFSRAMGTSPNPPNTFTTGALYNGQLAHYGEYGNDTYGGSYYSGQIDDVMNISMSNSLLNFTANVQGGVPHSASCALGWNTCWGLFEFSWRSASGANGNNDSISNAMWLDGWTNWPQSGEFDLNESGFGPTVLTTIHVSPTAGVDGPNAGNGQIMYSSSTYPGPQGGGSFDDGKFHVYGALVTPAYLAFYFDGNLIWQSNSSSFLNNITTTTNPPSAANPGSFGYHANSLVTSPSNLNFNGNIFLQIMGVEVGPTFRSAQFPYTAHCDWIRHSVLTPATGGPHV